jgi:hypothetical protein
MHTLLVYGAGAFWNEVCDGLDPRTSGLGTPERRRLRRKSPVPVSEGAAR